MHTISVEFLREPSKDSLRCKVARVPVVGDLLDINDTAYTVRTVFLLTSKESDEIVAIVRVV